jgi:hypothetical protein
MSNILKYLRQREWSMGNGQCPDCCGVGEDWIGDMMFLDGSGVGHKRGCKLAQAIHEAGGTPLMVGESKSTEQYEIFISKGGWFGTRPKTKDGCHRYKAFAEEYNKQARRMASEEVTKM